VWCPGQNKRIAPLSFLHGLIALTPEIDYNKTAMGLPPVTSVVFLITKFGKTWVSRRNIWDTSATPSGIKREWYVCMYKFFFFTEHGVSQDPCNYDVYAGSKPFSEIETKSLSKYIAGLSNLLAYVSFHSYGEILLLPYSDSSSPVDNYSDLVSKWIWVVMRLLCYFS
jgi:hypothetical protein